MCVCSACPLLAQAPLAGGQCLAVAAVKVNSEWVSCKTNPDRKTVRTGQALSCGGKRLVARECPLRIRLKEEVKVKGVDISTLSLLPEPSAPHTYVDTGDQNDKEVTGL